MDEIVNIVEFLATVGITLLYALSRFQEKFLEFKLTLDKEIAPLQQQQNEMEGELRRIDAVIRSEDIINVSDQDNNSLLIILIALLLLKSNDV